MGPKEALHNILHGGPECQWHVVICLLKFSKIEKANGGRGLSISSTQII